MQSPINVSTNISTNISANPSGNISADPDSKGNGTPLDLLEWLTQDFSPTEQKSTNMAWQIHKCQITESLISQHEPMKLIYHYESLDDEQKANSPLSGALLKQFDRLITREDFAALIKLPIKAVAKPWQLKFRGKLVIFTANPEVAIRLHWTNTLKPFDPVYTTDLDAAVLQAFSHWQFVETVEVISKNPQIRLIAHYKDHPQTDTISHWQPISHQQFEPLPSTLALQIQQCLSNSPAVQQLWLPRLQDLAFEQAEAWLLQEKV